MRTTALLRPENTASLQTPAHSVSSTLSTSSSEMIPKSWEDSGFLPFRPECSTVSYCLHFDQLWVSLLISIYYKKEDTPVRMAKCQHSKRWHECGERKTLTFTANWSRHCGNQWTGSVRRQKHDPAIPFLGICPKNAISYYRYICSSMFIAVGLTITRK